MTQRLEECKTATMLLYESDKEYEPGVVHGFGGMGGKQLLDYTYVLLWRPLSEKELSGSAENAAEKHRRVRACAATRVGGDVYGTQGCPCYVRWLIVSAPPSAGAESMIGACAILCY